MTSALPAPDYAPLDPEACKHQMILLKAWHCAYPVLLNGRENFIHSFSGGPVGGRLSMTVYLAGDPTPYDSALITIAERPQ